MKPTKTSLFILTLCFVLALLEFILENRFFSFWSILLAGWILLVIIERGMLAFNRIECSRRLRSTLFLGTPCTWTYQCHNRNRYPVRLLSRDQLPAHLQVSEPSRAWNLLAGQTESQPVTVLPLQPGKYSLQQIELNILGRLALFWWPRQIRASQNVNVKPARIKTSTSHPSSQLTLVIDLGQRSEYAYPSVSRLNRYINQAFSLAQTRLQQHKPVHVICYDSDIRLRLLNVRTGFELNRLLQFFESHSPAEQTSNHLLVARTLLSLRVTGQLFWFTDLDDISLYRHVQQPLRILRQRHEINIINSADRDLHWLRKQAEHRPLQPAAVYDLYARLENRRLSQVLFSGTGIAIDSGL